MYWWPLCKLTSVTRLGAHRPVICFSKSISKSSMSLLSRLALRLQGMRQGALTRMTLKWNEVQLPNPNFRFWDATQSMHIADHLKTSQAQALYPDCSSALDQWPHFDELSGRFFLLPIRVSRKNIFEFGGNQLWLVSRSR